MVTKIDLNGQCTKTYPKMNMNIVKALNTTN